MDLEVWFRKQTSMRARQQAALAFTPRVWHDKEIIGGVGQEIGRSEVDKVNCGRGQRNTILAMAPEFESPFWHVHISHFFVTPDKIKSATTLHQESQCV